MGFFCGRPIVRASQTCRPDQGSGGRGRLKKVSAWLGHANAGFTYRVYHHYLPEKLDDREAERLNTFLFGSGDTKKAGSS
ncbi:hypothetical protein [Neomoorella mulderi]|uniref:hypothetical protein n=1 Tax=Neomoorella mulderi TaxID=202604 RepID=UPI001471953C|nr:hypothetical protein [Moorella mulderi]